MNWETLGFFLYPEHNVDDLNREPANVRQYARMVLGNIYDSAQVMIYENSAVDQRRTVKIMDRGVSSMQFEIAPYSDLYVQLVELGRGGLATILGNNRCGGDGHLSLCRMWWMADCRSELASMIDGDFSQLGGLRGWCA